MFKQKPMNLVIKH